MGCSSPSLVKGGWVKLQDWGLDLDFFKGRMGDERDSVGMDI